MRRFRQRLFERGRIPARPTSPTSIGTSSSAPIQQPPVGQTLPTILNKTLSHLSDEDRLLVQHLIPTSSNDVDQVLRKAFLATETKQNEYLDKRQTFTIAGYSFTLREKSDKVIHWLNRFKAVGDIASNAAPVHAGLPWALLRIMLEVAVANANQMALLFTGCEAVSRMTDRLKVYLVFLDDWTPSLAKSNFETELSRFYAHILSFLAHAIRIYQAPRINRVFQGTWDNDEIQTFERKCNQLGAQLHHAASNCDRMGNVQVLQLLQKMARDHGLEESLNGIRVKIDLGKLLIADGAEFNAYGSKYETCHRETRIDVLREIQEWIRQPDGKCIFWLNGGAGTGKSTISRTVCEWLQDNYTGTDDVGLGASFFFKRGEGDRGSAVRFFPTIAQQLAKRAPALGPLLAEVIDKEHGISNKMLSEQFDKLIYRPLQVLTTQSSPLQPLIVVVDALDECEKDEDVKTILKLWSRLSNLSAPRLKLFITSRPELSIRTGFRNVSEDVHQDMVLHDVPQTTVQNDIAIYLRHEFLQIQKEFNQGMTDESRLENDWPGESVIQLLTNNAVPLFIVAATMLRFIGDHRWHPQKRLSEVLSSQNKRTYTIMERTYLPVLEQLLGDPSDINDDDAEQLLEEFRVIVGSIITLARPLSVKALSDLLGMSSQDVEIRLHPLHSVLQVPRDPNSPVRALHLSFGEFLMSTTYQEKRFRVDRLIAHRVLMERCLNILSQDLHENMCHLDHPGWLRKDIPSTLIQNQLSPAVQYACQYWVSHAQQGEVRLQDNDVVLTFLHKHFLHWLEALSLMGKASVAIGCIGDLQQLMALSNASYGIGTEEHSQPKAKLELSDKSDLAAYLEDARRFVLRNRHICDTAPLQVYSSAIVFSPQSSLVRNINGQNPRWITISPETPDSWDYELQQLEGHKSKVNKLAFSDGLLSSASGDNTLRLWDIRTGQEVLKLNANEKGMYHVELLPHNLIASSLSDGTMRIWSISTGQEMFKIEEVEEYPLRRMLVVLSTGKLITSDGMKIRVYDLENFQPLQVLRVETRNKDSDYSKEIYTMAVFQDETLALLSMDLKLELWDLKANREMQMSHIHPPRGKCVEFSLDGVLAVGCEDTTIHLVYHRTKQPTKVLTGHKSAIFCLAFSKTGLLASGDDDKVRLWDIETGQTVCILSHDEGLSIMCFLDECLLAIAADAGVIRVWDIQLAVRSQNANANSVSSDTEVIPELRYLESSLDEPYLISNHSDGTWRWWDCRIGQINTVLNLGDSAGPVVLSPVGLCMASVSSIYAIQLWDLKKGREISTLDGHTGEITVLQFSPDGSLLVSKSSDNTLRLWDTETGRALAILEVYEGAIESVVLSSDGSLMALVYESSVQLWDVETSQALATWKMDGYHHVRMVFSPDASFLALLTSDGWQLWNTKTFKTKQICKEHNSSSANRVMFSPCGSILAIAAGEEVVLSDINTGQLIQRFRLPRGMSWTEFPTTIQLTDDGQALVSLSSGKVFIDPPATSSLVAACPASPISAHGRVTVREDWIQWDGRDILWLPVEYRSYYSQVYGNMVAIFNYEKGKLYWIKLDYSCAPPLTGQNLAIRAR